MLVRVLYYELHSLKKKKKKMKGSLGPWANHQTSNLKAHFTLVLSVTLVFHQRNSHWPTIMEKCVGTLESICPLYCATDAQNLKADIHTFLYMEVKTLWQLYLSPSPTKHCWCSIQPGNIVPINIVYKGGDFNWWLWSVPTLFSKIVGIYRYWQVKVCSLLTL